MALGLRLATLLVAAVAVAWAGTLSDPFLIRAKVASAELAAPDALASAAGDVDAPTSSSSEPRAPTVLPPALAVESRAARHAEMLEEFHAEDVWKNDLMLFFVPADVRARIPHYVQTWLRNLVAVSIIYYVLGAVWVYYAHFTFGWFFFRESGIPSFADEWEQIVVATKALPLYALLPVLIEYCIERGWTRSYARVSDVGLARYVLYFVLYMAGVEYGVYWAHRLLHDIRVGYRKLHYIHHKYNKDNTMSPFAGLAFDALDGILQAMPYFLMLFVVPMHFLTHELLLFATGVWTTNIHDNIDGKTPPVMGAKYHTIHHTTYKHNYGHYFTYMDALHGTLLTPEAYDEKRHAVESQEEAEEHFATHPIKHD